MTFLIVIIALALLFDYINGFHDAANAITNVVSTKVLTPVQAVIWAAMFNFVAYFIFTDHGVAMTIARTVKEGTNAAGVHYVTLPVILAGVLAGICWNLLTWWFGIPSSSSHTLIGGFAGAAIAHTGLESISSGPILWIVLFIVIAPLIGIMASFLISLFLLNSFRKTAAPKIVSTGVLIAVFVFLYFVLNRDNETLKSSYQSYALRLIFDKHNFKWILFSIVVLAITIFSFFLSSLNYTQSERWFKRMQLISSAAFSIGQGGNDAQKVMGIIMVAYVAYDPVNYQLENMLWWVPLACYSAIALGTLSGGSKIIKTMGTKITKITPFEGIAADTAGALTLFITEFFNVPVSTTHTVAGCIMGAGATKRLSAVRWGVSINLLWAWLITIPISAGIAMAFYWVFHLVGLG